MTEVASAYVSLLPSAQGFGKKLTKAIGGDLDGAGREGGKRYASGLSGALAGVGGKVFAPLAAAAAAVSLGGLIKESVQLEASFSQTMATIGAVTGTPKAQIKELSDLAIKFGQDTVFSASEVSDSMLDLAKGGMSAAVIKAGGLDATLKLAAAGGTDLATAATISTNAMSAFGIKAEQASSVANALAGGANSSTASIESLGEALGQVGPGAQTAGLSLQETVAALAAFDAAGIKGSDAGTSLKTMLANLVPDTKRSSNAMRDLGLNFVKADGNFKDITEIAGDLQKALKPLSESEKTTKLNDIFGSDAARAGAVLAKEGSAGIATYLKATNSLTAAQEVADARMSGTAGALEALGGAWETLKLQFGQALAPAVIAGANFVNDALGKIGPALSVAGRFLAPFAAQLKTAFSAGGKGASALQPLIDGVKGFAAAILPALGPALKAIQAFGAAVLPVLVDFGTKLIGIVGPAIGQIGKVLGEQVIPAFTRFLLAITPIATFLLKTFGGAILGAISGVVKVVVGALKILAGIFNVIGGILTLNWDQVWTGIKQIASGAFQAIVGAIQVFLNVGILKAFRAGFTLLRSIVTGGWALIRGTFTGAISGLRGAVTGFFRQILTLFSTGVRTYVQIWATGLRLLLSGAKAAIGSVVKVFTGLRGNIIGALKSAGTWLLGVGGDIVRGLVKGISGLKDVVTDALLGLLPGPLKKFADKLGIRSPSKVFMKFGRYIGDGLVIGLQGTERQVRAAAERIASNVSAPVARQFRGELTALERLAGARSAMATKLKAATARLTAALKLRDDYATSIRDAVLASADITKISATGDAALTSGDIITGLKKQALAVATYRTQLVQLQKLGLNSTSLKQIADAGVDSGGKTAAALVAGGKSAVTQVNLLSKKLGTEANLLGQSTSRQFYQAGVDSALGFANGLKQQQSVLNSAAKSIAESIVAQLKKSLKIKSPSKVMASEVGRWIPPGIVAGIEAARPDLDRTMASLVAIPAQRSASMAIPAAAASPAGRGDVNIYGNVGWDPDEVAKRIENRQRDAAAVHDLAGIA